MSLLSPEVTPRLEMDGPVAHRVILAGEHDGRPGTAVVLPGSVTT
jgi:hypothetical protein